MFGDVVRNTSLEALTSTCEASRTEHDHGGINLVGLAAREDLGRVGVDGDAVAAVGRRAEEARRHLADPPRGLGFQKLRQRKPGAAVGSCRVLAIVADMRDAQIMLLRRVPFINLVEFCAAIIRRARALVLLEAEELEKVGVG